MYDIGGKLACTTALMIAFAFARASSLPVSSTCKKINRDSNQASHIVDSTETIKRLNFSSSAGCTSLRSLATDTSLQPLFFTIART